MPPLQIGPLVAQLAHTLATAEDYFAAADEYLDGGGEPLVTR